MTNMVRSRQSEAPRREREDYLVSFLSRLLAALCALLCSARTKCACTAIAAVSVVLFTLGIAGAVECGILSVYCLLPLCALWPLFALWLHMSRR